MQPVRHAIFYLADSRPVTLSSIPAPQGCWTRSQRSSSFKVEDDVNLSTVGAVGGLPPAALGLATRRDQPLGW